MKTGIFLICLILSLCAQPVSADEVSLKDGRVLKGVVVEDFFDRITLSTFEGERSIMKQDISRIKYDSDSDNLLSLGAQHMDRGDFKAAHVYYDKAHKLNPGSKAAKDGLTLSTQKLFKKEQTIHEGAVRKQAIIEDFRRVGHVMEDDIKDKEKLLRDRIGVVLKIDGVNPKVIQVLDNSAAEEAGIVTGDKIVAIWSRLTGYLDKDEMMSTLIDPAQRELKLTIERDIKVRKKRFVLFRSIKNLIGASFVMEWDGTVVSEVMPAGPAESAGLVAGDLVVKVEERPTRYMSLKEMYRIIKETPRTAVFSIRRDATVWKR